MKDSIIKDIIIIGGGPAGLAAALYTSRAGFSPLVFAGSPPGGQLTLTSEVENYLGFESILGPELINKMRKHAQKFGAKIVDENVKKVDFSKKPFKIYLSVDSSVEPILTNSVIIATGAKAMWLGLESEQRLRGKGVSACATCDGFFFRGKIVAVVGGGDTALEEALTLTKFAKKVYIIHRRDQFRASKIMKDRVFKHPKIKVIWNAVVEKVLGEEKVEGVRLKIKNSNSEVPNKSETKNTKYEIRNTKLSLDGLFIAIGHKPDTELFRDKVELDKRGYICTSVRKALDNTKFLIDLISNQAPKTNGQKIKQNKKLEIGELKIKNYLGQLEQLGISNFNYNFQSMTSVSGIFAAGDCVDYVYRQAGTAVGMGIGAALDVGSWLEESKS